MAIIVDDAGYDLAELQPFLELRIPLAVAVLPNLPHSREAALRVKQAGKELLLHLPMEPEGGEDPGPGVLLTGESPAEIGRLLESALQTVPGASGVNNHMGSKATADEAVMTTVLSVLGQEGLFFVDSRTTADTVGARVAARLGVPFLERDVFIDAAHSDGEIDEAFASGIARAARQGTAILIGHVQNPAVLAILRDSDRALREARVRLSTLSDILDRLGRGSHR
ncbi:MAG: divergent polysaccharide deacetylase family protein [Acidobacteria bacterium]|nr:divergent polysaccharide deacetylase family protein [Acidobacteriota bacterium]